MKKNSSPKKSPLENEGLPALEREIHRNVDFFANPVQKIKIIADSFSPQRADIPCRRFFEKRPSGSKSLSRRNSSLKTYQIILVLSDFLTEFRISWRLFSLANLNKLVPKKISGICQNWTSFLSRRNLSSKTYQNILVLYDFSTEFKTFCRLFQLLSLNYSEYKFFKDLIN